MLRVAGVGLGDLGRLECRLLDDLEDVELVAGADPSPGARATFREETGVAAYESIETMLAEEAVDAVTIASPHTLHYEQARACLTAGAHVHLEKPMVTDLDHARDLVSRAEAADLTLAVGYQRHFDPRFRELRRILDTGRIGTPHMAACHLEQVWIEWTKDQWRGNPSLSGGGQLYDSGSHLLDALLWCTRSDPVSVAATVDDRGYEVDVNSALSTTLDRDGDRLTASVAVSGEGQSVPAPGEAIHVWGTEGAVSYDGERIEVTESGTTYTARPVEPDFERVTRDKLANWVAAIRDEERLQIPAADAVKVTALTEAAYESAETDERVTIDL